MSNKQKNTTGMPLNHSIVWLENRLIIVKFFLMTNPH